MLHIEVDLDDQRKPWNVWSDRCFVETVRIWNYINIFVTEGLCLYPSQFEFLTFEKSHFCK